MEDIKKEHLKNLAKKFCLKELGLILLGSLILFFLYYAKTESFLVDVGREAYLPLRVLEGKLLYKDIFNVYGPLSYQINAVAYAIFGANLRTLYWMGFVNSLLILFSIFFIAKNFVSKKLSLCIVFLVMVSCVYIKTFFNFIFPYSYAAVYALSGVLLSILGILQYISSFRNDKMLILSFLFAGFAFANKIEYMPFFAFLFAILIFLKPSLKTVFACIAAFLAVPVLSFGMLMLQGVSLGDFWTALGYVKDIIKTPALDYFYSTYGLYYSPEFVKFSVISFIKLFAFLIPYAALLYGLNYLAIRFIKTKFLRKILNGGIFVLLLFTISKTFGIFSKIDLRFFSWTGLFAISVLAGFLIYYAVKLLKTEKGDKKSFKVRKKDMAFLFLIASSILLSLKGITAVGAECYGTFSLALLLPVFSIFSIRYLPKMLPFIDNKIWKKVILNLFFVVIILVECGVLRIALNNPLYPVKTDRGTIFVKASTRSMDNLIKFIRNNTPEDAMIVSAPEGAMINFLSKRKTHDKYYYLIPVNVQLFGEDNIVADFEKNPPDYFLLNSLPYYCFNTGNICQYANKLCKFIDKNYKLKASANSGIEFFLYEKL